MIRASKLLQGDKIILLNFYYHLKASIVVRRIAQTPKRYVVKNFKSFLIHKKIL